MKRRANLIFLSLLLLATSNGLVGDGIEQFGYGAVACKSKWNAPNVRGCGRSVAVDTGNSQSQKVLHGHEVANDEYPWVVAVARMGSSKRLRFYCGGSVVGKAWVLTAGHCKVQVGDFVLVGRHDLTSDAGRQIRVDRVVPCSPPFQSQTKAYDAMLLHLAEIVTTESIDLNEDPAIEENGGTKLTIAGWGTTSYLGRPSNVLLEADISTRVLTGCKSVYGHSGHEVARTSFCATGDKPAERVDLKTGETVADACQGDSGGGAFRHDRSTGKYQLVGIVSWGIGCGNDALPGVYTRSSSIIEWLKPITQKL